MSKPFVYTLDKNASKVHKAIVQYFKKELPSFNISQNHKIEIDNKNLYCDIFCNSPFHFVIEIMGEQHYKFIKHFHGTEKNFRTAQLNDRLKREWCEMNDYCYIEIPVKGFAMEKFHDMLMEKLHEFSEEG